MEISTFVSKGTSFEASDGNHDDLMMNLVMFGYFINTQSFLDQTNVNIKELIFEQRMKEIEDDVPPFGIIDDGQDWYEQQEVQESYNKGWHNFEAPDAFSSEDW
jgi:hypothetical protein